MESTLRWAAQFRESLHVRDPSGGPEAGLSEVRQFTGGGKGGEWNHGVPRQEYLPRNKARTPPGLLRWNERIESFKLRPVSLSRQWTTVNQLSSNEVRA